MSLANTTARAAPRQGPVPKVAAVPVDGRATSLPLDATHAHTQWESEPFIPVSRFEIAERMANNGTWGEVPPDTIRRLFRYLSAWRHVIYKERLDEMERTYLPFSPETDLLRIGSYTQERIADDRKRFTNGIKRLLQQANYIEVPREEVPHFMSRATVHGLDLKVDLDDFEEIVVYRRGTDYKLEQRPTWRTFYAWNESFRVPVYQRLCVMLKLWPEDVRIKQLMATRGISRWRAARVVKASRAGLPEGLDSDRIYIKLFRDIPQSNLQMLFPNSHIRFSRADKIRLGTLAAGGVGASLFGTVSSLMTASVLSPYLLFGAVFGVGGILFRQVLGFFNQRTQYVKVLAQNLYLHSLADNRSAFTLLANRAEEEDVKEEILLYSVLATRSTFVRDLPAVKAEVSDYLKREFNVDVAFDVFDALDRLVRDRVVRVAPDGLLLTLAPEAALEHFDTMWDGYLQPHGLDRSLLSEEPALT